MTTVKIISFPTENCQEAFYILITNNNSYGRHVENATNQDVVAIKRKGCPEFGVKFDKNHSLKELIGLLNLIPFSCARAWCYPEEEESVNRY